MADRALSSRFLAVAAVLKHRHQHQLSVAVHAVLNGTPLELEVASGAVLSLFPILMCAHGDTPWAAKLACGCGHTAAHACHRCGIVGTKCNADGERLSAVSFGGASEDAECRTFDLQGFHHSTISYTDPHTRSFNTSEARRIQTTDAMYDMRANAAEKAAVEEHDKFMAWCEKNGEQPPASPLHHQNCHTP
jgi:hypothetical protein